MGKISLISGNFECNYILNLFIVLLFHWKMTFSEKRKLIKAIFANEEEGNLPDTA